MDFYWRRLRLIAFGADATAVLVAYVVAAGWRVGFGDMGPGGWTWPVYPALSVGIAVLTLILGWQFGTYRRWALFGGHRVYPLLITVATYGVVTVIVLSYVISTSPFLSRSWLLGSWIGSAGLLSVGRLLVRRIALHWQTRGCLVRRILIAGANQQGIAVAEQLNDPARHGIQVLGFLDDYERPGTRVVKDLQVLGHPASVLDCAAALRADEVVIIPNGLTWESQRLLAELVTRPDSPIEARISATFYDLLTTSAELSHVAYVPMLTLHRTRLSGMNARMKALVDRVVAASLLAFLLPFWSYCRVKAWWRRVPMLRRHRVAGLSGRTFELLSLEPGLTASPVVARLPALWNVFRQDMSLVGPRPIREQELHVHQPWLANLWAMRPGLTGLWRLRGGVLTLEQSVALDLYYVRNYSLIVDAQVLLHTARKLTLRGVGAPAELARWDDAVSSAAAGQGPEEATAAPTTAGQREALSGKSPEPAATPR